MPGDDTKIDLLGKYRESDQRNAQGEVLPDQETLSPPRIRSYLEKNGFNVNNFDQRFNYNSALQIIEGKRTSGEALMYTNLTDAKAYLDKIGLGDLIEQTNEASFRSTLNKELMRRNDLGQENKMVEAYLTYNTIRKLARRSLELQEQFTQKREEEKAGAEGGIKEQFAGVLKDVQKNFGKMSSGEKLATVGALLGVGIWFFSSDNENVKAAREKLWDVAKVAGVGVGVGVGVNYVWKLFTGKTALTALGDWTDSTAGNNSFWTETFKTDDKNAETLRKSTIYMGDKDFLDMAKRYREAKANNTNKIQLATVLDKDMKPEDIYTALDTFFSRYPVEKLEARYHNYSPRPTWMDVVRTEMAEDGRFEMKPGVMSRAVDAVQEYATRGWNWMMVGEGFGVVRYLYLKARGKEGTPEEIKEWAEKFLKRDVMREADLDKHLEDKYTHQSAQQFKLALHGGSYDPGTGVKFVENPGDSLYIVSDVHIDNIAGDEKAIGDAVKGTEAKATEFLKKRYPDLAENIGKFMDVSGGVRVVENSTFKMFVRMPLKGTPEFGLRSVGLQKPPGREERSDYAVFGPNSKLEYDAMAPWNQEKIRIRFLLDANQTAELGKVCDWFTRKYQTQNLKIQDVMTHVLEDDADRELALRETGVAQGLMKNNPLLQSLESDIVDIEKGAAKDLNGVTQDFGYTEMGEKLRNTLGYKFRLAILGESLSQMTLGYNPNEADAVKSLLKKYKKECTEYVERRNKGL